MNNVGVMTAFESEMSRIAQLLRDLLSRRPTREDLQRQGIYQGKKRTQINSRVIHFYRSLSQGNFSLQMRRLSFSATVYSVLMHTLQQC